MQGPGSNQNAHLALVKSLAAGTPKVDRYRTETPDVSYIDGHYYTAKAPGLALATEPWYLALDGVGLAVKDRVSHLPFPEAMARVPRSALWELGIIGAVLPALVCLFLVRGVADELVPGFGAAGAVLLGLGSTLGIFATLFFAHALSATLGFAAFAVLVQERRHSSLRLVAGAGALAGLAVVAEFPLVLVGAVLAVYAVARPDRGRRLAAFAVGGALGVTPLLVFDTWAFGTPWKLSYTNAVIVPGQSGHDVVGANSAGLFGVQEPSLRAGLDLLASSKGLLVLTPVWALTAVGVVALWRRGRTAEAAVIAAVAGAFLLYDSAYYLPFGGFPGGPRFLVPMLPFLAVAVAAAAAAIPLTVLSLGIASVAVTVTALVVDPGTRSEDAGSWFHALERGAVTRTVVGWAGGSDRLGAAIVVVAAAGAVLLAVLATGRPVVTGRQALLAVAALVLWRVAYVGGPVLLDRPGSAAFDLVAVLGLLAAVGLCLVLVRRVGGVALAGAAVLLPVAWPRFAAHDRLTLAVVACSLAISVVLLRRSGARLARPRAETSQRAS